MNAAIKAEIAAIRERLDELEAKTVGMNTVALPATSIELLTGERWAGIVLNEDGTPRHHLILMAYTKDACPWAEAVAWAQSVGGELPTRQEQSLLYANLKGEFESELYWSGEGYESDSRYAWFQDFDDGTQGDCNVYNELRARAVRRSVIQLLSSSGAK